MAIKNVQIQTFDNGHFAANAEMIKCLVKISARSLIFSAINICSGSVIYLNLCDDEPRNCWELATQIIKFKLSRAVKIFIKILIEICCKWVIKSWPKLFSVTIKLLNLAHFSIYDSVELPRATEMELPLNCWRRQHQNGVSRCRLNWTDGKSENGNKSDARVCRFCDINQAIISIC